MKKIPPEKKFKAYYASPIGLLEALGTDKGLESLRFARKSRIKKGEAAPCLNKCLKQLDDYFKGRRKVFSLKFDLRGTEFQKRVWRKLLAVPYGKTVSYKDIAKALGNEHAVRAVGGANHRNPIPVIIPCHRVLGAGGRLTGYGGGLWRKEWLLAHEKKFSS